ncbi:MAG: LPXTG cell wall anchor domain-containing protein, partial [Ruminococcus sp.]|nr:LPXTG cell wall anchor domain-containing protein [Ruminococcus sp.]
ATEEATTTSATEEATTTSVTEKATTTTSATEKAITTATTEEATTTSTEEVTTTTTTMKEREVLTTTTTIANNHIASDEEICNWAVNDYNYKNFDSKKDAVKAVSAEITGKSDNYYEITLKDASGNVLDVYEINPENGIGADTNNVEVNLPQTGNNSLTNILVAFTAFMMTMTGFVSVKFSGIFRRKENE